MSKTNSTTINTRLTIVTPTPKITPHIKKNLKVIGQQTSWLIVWTNPNQPAPKSTSRGYLKVINYPKKFLPINNFAKLRNWTLRQVKTDWILFLDSDEILTQSSWNKLVKLLQQSNSLINGYLIKREDVFLGKTLKHGEVGNVWLMRLGRRRFMRYERVVHEIAGIQGMTEKSDVVIKHYSHKSVSSFINKVNFYAKLEAKSRHTLKPKLWFELIFYPPLKLIYNFIFKLGWLDGMRGLVYASIMSLHSLLVRIYQLEK